MTETENGASTAEPSPLADVELYERLKGWFLEDRRAQSEWYKDAESDFAFHAGHGQWEEADRQRLKGQNRPCVTFNRIGPAVAAVVGMEVANRQEVRFIPRTTSSKTSQSLDPATGQPINIPIRGADDQGPAELYTGAALYLRDQCNAEDEESDAFQDTAICGMGWTETRVDYDDDPSGKIVIDRVDPLEMAWDVIARVRHDAPAAQISWVSGEQAARLRAGISSLIGQEVPEGGSYLVVHEPAAPTSYVVRFLDGCATHHGRFPGRLVRTWLDGSPA